MLFTVSTAESDDYLVTPINTEYSLQSLSQLNLHLSPLAHEISVSTMYSCGDSGS